MSALMEIKSLVLSGLKNEDLRVKKAAIRVFNAIDTDLDSIDYDPIQSEEDTAVEVVNAIQELNSAFVDLAVDIDTKEEAEGSENIGEDLPSSLTEDNGD